MSTIPAASQAPQTTAIQAAEAQLHFAEVPLPPVDTLTNLATLRVQQNISLDAAASSLRLSQAQISAMESQHWTALPSAAYVKGFLRNYARFLGVAPEPYIAQFEATLNPANGAPATSNAAAGRSKPSAIAQAPLQLHKDPTALSSFSPSAHQDKSNHSLFGMLGLLILATIAFLLYWERGLWLPKATALAAPITAWVAQTYASTSTASAKAEAKATAMASSAAASNTGDTNAAISSQASPAPAPAPSTIEAATPPTLVPPSVAENKQNTKPALGPIRAIAFQLDKAVWLEVRDSGNNILYYGTKTAGTQATIKGAAPLSVVIGAADALKMSVDGAAIDLKKQAVGNVARVNVE